MNRNRDLHPRTRALYRLLTMRKANLVDSQKWDAVNCLESHIEEYLHGPNPQMVIDTCIAAKSQTNSTDMNMLHLQTLYCSVRLLVICGITSSADTRQILTNCMNIYSAEGRTLGTTLDLVASLTNHSCDPAAHVFFEGKCECEHCVHFMLGKRSHSPMWI